MRAPTSNQPQDESFDRQADGDDDRSDGCFRFAGQVLGGRQLRLPASFQRASSLPRRIARSVTPTPAGREPEVRASARAQLRAESSDVELKGSKKRAASTSPSRNEFRRSLKDRIPRQLRSLIPARMMPGYNLPPRPTRKAGPVGRTWVKVYDDITYMDDTSQEYYPIVGYTGAPVKVPEANPLPRAPTPPPPRRQRSSRRVSPTPSQLSEYDNVPRKEQSTAAERNGSQKETDQELILQELSNNRMRKLNQEISMEERQQEVDRELILKELTMKQMNGQNELPDPNYENSDVPVERPTARKRENTRFKGRRQKRSGTPIASDRMTNGLNDENAMASGNQTFETIEYSTGESMRTSVPENEYIIPEKKSSPPSRPKRGTKIYEGVNTLESEKPQTTEATVIDFNDGQAEILDSPSVSEPTRPARGVKVYETVLVSKNEIFPEITQPVNITKDTPNVIQSDVNKVEDSEEQKGNGPSIEPSEETARLPIDNSATVTETPVKPKRGVKVYEDIILSSESTPKMSSSQALKEEKPITEEKSVALSSLCESRPQKGECAEAKTEEEAPKEGTDSNEIKSDFEEKPTKPQRGIKLYEDVIPLSTNLTKTAEDEITKPSKPKRGVKLYEDVTVKDTSNALSLEEKVIADSKEVVVPSKPERGKKVYSSMDFSDKEKTIDGKSWNEREQHEGIPPYATVQKGKDSQMKAATMGDNDAPPPIPPKKRARQTTSGEVTDVVPPRPARHLKPLDGSGDIRSSKRQKIGTKAGSDPQEPPQKPTRSCASNSKVKVEPIVGKVTLESGRTPEMSVSTFDSESYENMVLPDPRIKFRSRPLPPTPGQTSEEGNTSVKNASLSAQSTSGTPVGSEVPAAKENSLVITGNDESHDRNEAPQADSTNVQSISTADGIDVEGSVSVTVASDGLESKRETMSVNATEHPLVSSESVLQFPESNIGFYPCQASDVHVQDNTTTTTAAALSERTRTCEYCGHRASDSSQTGENVRFVQSVDGEADVANNVLQASLQLRSYIDGENSSIAEVSVECIQKPCLITAVPESTEAECTEPTTATDKLLTDEDFVENSATQDQVQTEEPTASSVTVDTKSLKEVATVKNDSEPSCASAEFEAAETTIEKGKCVIEAVSDERSDSGRSQIQPERDSNQNLSVAAESVVENFAPESTENLIVSSNINNENLKNSSDPDSEADRRLSVAAETVIVNFVPESIESLAPTTSNIEENIIQESTSTCFSERKLSVAAEGISSSVTETVEVKENVEIPSGVEVKMHGGDGRKMSIAAESITVESTPESTQVLDISVVSGERNGTSVESAVASVVSSDNQSTDKSDRKISVAAETISLSVPESVQDLNSTGNDQQNSSVSITSVVDSNPDEINRKISIAAETVALEFMPETTQTLHRESLETANIVAINESGASSVAAVSIISGNFADTVTNKTSDSILTGSQPSHAVVEAPTEVLSQLSGNIPESASSSSVNVSADNICTAYQPQESCLIETKTSDSLSGSQTSITDDDSVVSVVAKAEVAESGKEPSSDSHGEAKPSDLPVTAVSVETSDSDLKGGVTDINDRLEGISNFLDSVVRNFFPAHVDNANDTFCQSDSSPFMDPVSTSCTNSSVPACSVSVDVSSNAKLPMTNRETDDRDVQTENNSQSKSNDSVDLISSLSTSNQVPPEEQTSSSHSEAPATPPCVNSPSPSIATSAPDDAVPAGSEGTVRADQKYPITNAFQGNIVRKEPDNTLPSVIQNLGGREQESDSSVETCTSSPESSVSQRQPVPTVFDLLDSGFGFRNDGTSKSGSVSIFIEGEWHRL